MLKRIFILILIFITTSYGVASLTTYLSERGSEKAYKIYESRFNEMQEKLLKKDTLATQLSPEDIKVYSQIIVESENKQDESVKPEFMKMFHEGTLNFSKELAKKQIISFAEKKKQEKNVNIDKNTMNGYLEEARISGQEDELRYFLRGFVSIEDDFSGYKIQTKEYFFKASLIFSSIVLIVLILFITFFYMHDEEALDSDYVRFVTYIYLFVWTCFYIVYFLANWLFIGV